MVWLITTATCDLRATPHHFCVKGFHIFPRCSSSNGMPLVMCDMPPWCVSSLNIMQVKWAPDIYIAWHKIKCIKLIDWWIPLIWHSCCNTVTKKSLLQMWSSDNCDLYIFSTPAKSKRRQSISSKKLGLVPYLTITYRGISHTINTFNLLHSYNFSIVIHSLSPTIFIFNSIVSEKQNGLEFIDLSLP